MSTCHVRTSSRGRLARTLVATAVSAVVLVPWGQGVAGAAVPAASVQTASVPAAGIAAAGIPAAGVSTLVVAGQTRAAKRFPHIRTWNRLAGCESGRRWHINTGNGYYGGLQFSSSTWRGYRGRRYASYAHRASKVQQILIARKVRRSQGWGAWPSCSSQLRLGR